MQSKQNHSNRAQRRNDVARQTVLVLIASLLAAIYPAATMAQPLPAAAPTTAPSPATAPGGARSAEQITIEFVEAGRALEALVPDQSVLRDPAVRERLAPRVVPVVKKIVDLLDELAKAGGGEGVPPEAFAEAIVVQRIQAEPLLLAFGDAGAAARAATRAASKDPVEAALGRGGPLIASHLVAGKEADQLKVADALEGFLKENKSSVAVDFTAALILIQPTASDEVAGRLLKVVATTPPGPMTENVQMQVESRRIQKGFENKPITLSGTLVDGKPFSTAQWKGKVILVDFWATWCGPCIAELPHLKETYKKYHEQGFEVLGVSNDYSMAAVSGFVGKDPEMSWPQVFDPQAAAKKELHPLAVSHGINGIPVVFLIDRKGVLRSVEGRRNMDAMIPQLLAEKAD